MALRRVGFPSAFSLPSVKPGKMTMRLDFAFFAKAVEFDSTGGAFHSLYSGIEQIFVQSIPATIPSLGLVLRIVSDRPDEAGEHELGLEIYDPDGQRHEVSTRAKFRMPTDNERAPLPAKAVVAFVMQGFELPKVGTYEFRVLLGGVSFGSILLLISMSP